MTMNRSRHIITYYLLMPLLLAWSLSARADLADRYNSQHPLTIVNDRDFPPFEFSNDNGQPDGLNVDVLGRILRQLNIPHTFVMLDWHQAASTFESHKADLIFAPTSMFSDSSHVKSRNVFSRYKLEVAYRKGTVPLRHISDLTPADTLVLKASDYATVYLSTHPHTDFKTVFMEPREALTALSRGQYKYFVWGSAPMKRQLKELSINNIELGSIDIPGAEMFLVGYDIELLKAIDDQYTRLEQKGQLKSYYDQWLYPDKVHDDSSPLVLIVIITALLVGIVGFMLNRLIHLRVKASVKKATDLNNMMEQALGMGDLYVFEYNLRSGVFTCSSQGESCLCGDQQIHMIPPGGITIGEFLERQHPNLRPEVEQTIAKLESGTTEQHDIKLCWNIGTDEAPTWLYLNGHAVVENEGGQRRYLVITAKDVTRDIHEERTDNELGKRYRKIFDTNPIAMSFYDSDGWLLDLNDNMRRLFGFDELGEEFFRQVRLFDIYLIKDDFNPDSRDDFHVCEHITYPEVGIDRYIESRIRPICDANGQLIYYVITSRETTDERTLYLQQHKMDTELRTIGEAVNNYEQQLRYLLENSNMFVWQFDLQTRKVNFSRSLKEVDFSYSIQDYIDDMVEGEQEDAKRNFMRLISTGSPFNAIHHFYHTPANPSPSWYALNGLPTHNAAGQMTGYFGVCRDITDLMEAQEQLKRETLRAEQSGRMKSAFLANMTHEIRTPLNAIVGFSDLLQVIDEPEDRKEFIRIIRNNCDMLLRLINDILEASDMGQALAIEPADIDFAPVFSDICQTLAQRVQEPGVEFISDNPYPTFPARLDKGRVQQVITNFVTNAVKYTHQGHIRVGYREQDGGIYIYCEDTGAGIPKDRQASVFDRFVKLNDNVQGTGLGLSICRSIAERCGGRIGVTSEGEGHGSTFWIWIPRGGNDNDNGNDIVNDNDNK